MWKLFTVITVSLTSAFALSNLEVSIKSDNVMNGFKDSVATMKMQLINARGKEKIRFMSMKVLEGKDADKSLMEFQTPADVKGTKFLNYEHINKDDDQWLYLPALKRIKRIASKNKSGAFMGSEFSYEDLSAFNVKKYTYEGDAKEGVVDGLQIYIVSSKPVSKHSGYTKLISYIGMDDFLIRKTEYFDRKKQLLKTAYFSQYKKFGDINRIGKIQMINIQNDKRTTLTWIDEKIKTGLKEKDFHKRHLKK
ncbi:outer membrane lipoprotein-sorting protein [Sulfurimonas sp. SAG-AH-194-I05]|nr:outer membrane lipoprotein-sorting protein [Sulfurimonas sp. SAG-AH-194-I05]MDF1875160.1 outer membrane lipoprotein-sorting protein [Sulfurimonas sp. SAG-AH-194-I05]